MLWHLAGLILALWLVSAIRQRFFRLPLPPGPTALPLIGNIHQLPDSNGKQWQFFHRWAQEFGPIFRLLAGKDTVVVLGDWDTAHELLDRRAANYASRPRMPMANELLYRDTLHITLRPASDGQRLHRRMVDRFFTPAAVRAYRPVVEHETLRLLRYLFDHTDDGDAAAAVPPPPTRAHAPTPEKAPKDDSQRKHGHFPAFDWATTRYTASVVSSVTYGFRIGDDTDSDPSLLKARVANTNFLEALTRVWPCDVFPWFNALPLFLAPWKRKAREWFAYQRDHHLEDLARAKAAGAVIVEEEKQEDKEDGKQHGGGDGVDDDVDDGNSSRRGGGGKRGRKWTLAGAMLASEEAVVSRMSELEIAFDAGVIVDAGVDTTANTLVVALLAATRHPDKARKAREEMDAVLLGAGDGELPLRQLPGFEHRAGLPYLAAFIQEVMRWRPLVPSGIPHSNLREDVFRTKDGATSQYRIPKGSVVVANAWLIHMDEKVFGADAAEFRPERHLENPRLPMVGFGFGRRVCVGQHLARDELFLAVARLLWAFEFEAVGEGGVEGLDHVAFTDSVVIKPKPFPVRLRVRHGARGVFEDAWAKAGSGEIDIRPMSETSK